MKRALTCRPKTQPSVTMGLPLAGDLTLARPAFETSLSLACWPWRPLFLWPASMPFPYPGDSQGGIQASRNLRPACLRMQAPLGTPPVGALLSSSGLVQAHERPSKASKDMGRWDSSFLKQSPVWHPLLQRTPRKSTWSAVWPRMRRTTSGQPKRRHSLGRST
jgi:hypothetical protein